MNRYQPKVEDTKQYSDSQGDHRVAVGILKLLPLENKRQLFDSVIAFCHRRKGTLHAFYHDDENSPSPEERQRDYYPLRPMIFSPTETVSESDYAYDNLNEKVDEIAEIGEGYRKTPDGVFVGTNHCKVLALPSQFSEKHLNAIVDGKMKDGDRVLIKCEPTEYNSWKKDKLHRRSQLHLNRENLITLFPDKQSIKKHEILSAKDSHGNVFTIDDRVTHAGAGKETATITGFYYDTKRGEIRANTTKGNGGLDYLSHAPDPVRCPNCDCSEINTSHNQTYLGGTVKWKECDECGEIIDPDSNKEDADKAKQQYLDANYNTGPGYPDDNEAIHHAKKAWEAAIKFINNNP